MGLTGLIRETDALLLPAGLGKSIEDIAGLSLMPAWRRPYGLGERVAAERFVTST